MQLVYLNDLEHPEEWMPQLTKLYAQFTRVSKITDFNRVFNMIKDNSIIILLVDDVKLIGTGKLLIEHKLYSDSSCVGHIEDIVVDDNYRGLGYGQLIVKTLIEEAYRRDCYKVVLDCRDELIPFYESCGLIRKGSFMGLYFIEPR